MLGCFRLLKRFSALEIPSPLLILNSTNLFTTTNLSSLLPRITSAGRSNGTGRLFLFHRLEKQRLESFSANATDPEEPTSSKLSSPYLSVRIHCNKNVAVTLSEALLCFGADSASMDELEDFNNTWITSIFADGQDVHTCISHAADSIGLDCIPKYEISRGEQCDWVANIQETFHPIEITADLWIVPNWRVPPVSQAMNIMLDPGLAFGTGEHPTTKLCLLLLHDLMKGGEHFLDYGTGSGVLGIAAVKMGAALSVGIDIDPQAVTSALQNIALNGIDSDKMLVYLVPSSTAVSMDGMSQRNLEEKTSYDQELIAAKRRFDVVIANILLNPLMDLAEDIVAFGKPGAAIGLSGILSEQVQQVRELYSRYLDNITVSEMDGWACLHGTRNKLV